MTAIPHGDIFKYLKDIRTDGEQASYEARIPILMLLISTADKRLQTWHSTESIMKYTGFSKDPVTKALSWFESRGAIFNVPKESRMGNAKRIHGNRKVWQLTGILQLGKTIIDYIHIKDEDRQSSLLEVEDYAPEHVKKLFRKLGLLSETKEIGSDNELETGSENSTKNDKISSLTRPEIGSENRPAKELSKKNLVKLEELNKDSAAPVAAAPKAPKSIKENEDDISQNDLAKIIALVEQITVLTPYSMVFLKEDANLYSIDEWREAVAIVKERQREQKITKPYKYLLGVLRSKATEAKENPAYLAPYHEPAEIIPMATPEEKAAIVDIVSAARAEFEKQRSKDKANGDDDSQKHTA